MPRPLMFLPLAILLVSLLGSDSPRQYDDTTIQVDAIEGTWQFVSVEYSGKTFPNSTRMIFQKGKWTWGGSDPNVTGTYKVDSSKRPAWVDMTTTNVPTANPTMKAIYLIDGDVLKMANGPRAVDRPLGFDTKDTPGVAVWTLKRVK